MAAADVPWLHEPERYTCPFCAVVAGTDDVTLPQDIVYQDGAATASIAPKWWVHNPGSVIIIPDKHTENIYTIPDETMAHISLLSKKIARAIRETYTGCTGTSIRQHNEPAGNQAVWHYHLHVFGRYDGDNLYQNHDNKRFVSSAERAPYVAKLRAYLN